MNEIALATSRRRWVIWLSVVIALIAGLGVLVWLRGIGSAPAFVEYRMLSKTDIPTAISVAPNGAVWFTIDFSDAIGIVRDGRIERLTKRTQNLEPLGLAVDNNGGAWYTDTTERAISRMSPGGEVSSFPLSTPIVRLGRLAMAPDGAVWFADIAIASVTRLDNGVFTPHQVGAGGATPYGVAVDPDGTVWTTLQGTDKLGRISTSGQLTTFDVPTRNSGLGDIVVDQRGAVWFLELRTGRIARFADDRFAEFTIPTPSSGLTTLAAAPDGSVWFTELSAGKLGRLRNGQVTEFRLPRPDARPFGVTVDAKNNVWYTDLSGWLGMLSGDQATAL